MYQRDDYTAPHKPLLLLAVLRRFIADGSSSWPLHELDTELAGLLEQAGIETGNSKLLTYITLVTHTAKTAVARVVKQHVMRAVMVTERCVASNLNEAKIRKVDFVLSDGCITPSAYRVCR